MNRIGGKMEYTRNNKPSTHATEAEARRSLQRYLKTISQTDPDIPPVPVDGREGNSTTEAVRIFQNKYGFPVTGKADTETWNAICDAYEDAQARLEPPMGVRLFPLQPVTYTVSKGERGMLVEMIQYMLSELTLIFPEFSNLKTDGIYGDKTADAVRIFQARALCPETGSVDRETWNTLVRIFDTLHLYTEP